MGFLGLSVDEREMTEVRGGVDHSGARSEDVHHAGDDVLEPPVVGVDDQVCLFPKCWQTCVRLLVSACIVHQNVQSLVALSVMSLED